MSHQLTVKTIITFDPLMTDRVDPFFHQPMPLNYAGLEWENGGLMAKSCASRLYRNTGFNVAFQGDVSCVVFNYSGAPMKIRSKVDRFSIISFEATCAFQKVLMLAVIGRRSQVITEQKSFILSYEKLSNFDLQWNNIDELEFITSGGDQLPHCTDTDMHFVLTRLNLA